MVKILGIKYGGHDTSASLLIDGKIIAACAQERYSKDKHSRKFPIDAINDCLKIGKIKISKIDEIAFVGDINLYFREMYLNHALKSKKRMKNSRKSPVLLLKQYERQQENQHRPQCSPRPQCAYFQHSHVLHPLHRLNDRCRRPAESTTLTSSRSRWNGHNQVLCSEHVHPCRRDNHL